MPRTPKIVRANKNGVLQSGKVCAFAFAKRLAAAVDFIRERIGGLNFQRQATTDGDDRRKGPPTEDASGEAALISVNVRLVDGPQIPEELAVPRLQAVGTVQIVRIRNGELAGCLNFRTGAQRLSIRKIALHGDSAPVGHFQSNETRIVVAPPNAGVHSNA